MMTRSAASATGHFRWRERNICPQGGAEPRLAVDVQRPIHNGHPIREPAKSETARRRRVEPATVVANLDGEPSVRLRQCHGNPVRAGVPLLLPRRSSSRPRALRKQAIIIQPSHSHFKSA